MKAATVVAAFVVGLSVSTAFADTNAMQEVAADIPAVQYHYGMELDIDKVLYRTDNSMKQGVVPTILVYQDHKGETHKIRYLSWGGRTNDQS